MIFGGIFDIQGKKKRLEELEQQIQNPEIWNKHGEMQKINKEKVLLEKSVLDWEGLHQKVEDNEVLLEMAVEEKDETSFEEVRRELSSMHAVIKDLELKTLLSGESDPNSSYLSINSGAGGTEACDWAQMLYRMYTRYAEKHGYRVEILEMTEGEGAGIKSVTMLIEGPYAYGHLKAESGVHRLVRISPFDSNARRHTSFASVFAWPEVDDEIQIDIKTEDLRIDTYRSGGAGGQHVNRTDSAVRITHLPTNVVVQCQSERSQISNREKAFKMLRAALYEREMEKRRQEKEALDGTKAENEWGSQIRSYVLHPYKMVKDLRTETESGTPDRVLDGDLDEFIESYLKQQATGGV
ncbi:MAG: peptide chain release factor 2 [Bdellovibrionales bacterium]|nr:peptide chain release factor 2 [Bdellovibrionales bacterium]